MSTYYSDADWRDRKYLMLKVSDHIEFVCDLALLTIFRQNCDLNKDDYNQDLI
jgi:hypothetical protein